MTFILIVNFFFLNFCTNDSYFADIPFNRLFFFYFVKKPLLFLLLFLLCMIQFISVHRWIFWLLFIILDETLTAIWQHLNNNRLAKEKRPLFVLKFFRINIVNKMRLCTKRHNSICDFVNLNSTKFLCNWCLHKQQKQN